MVTNALENRPGRAIEDQMEKGLLPIVGGESEAAQVISQLPVIACNFTLPPVSDPSYKHCRRRR